MASWPDQGLFHSQAAAGTLCFQLTLLHVDNRQPFPQIQSVLQHFVFHLEVQSPKSGFHCMHSRLQNPCPMPVWIWILLPLPLAQALIKEANEGGEWTVKSLTCYAKLLLCKTLGEMSNARWPGGEERTSGSAFST